MTVSAAAVKAMKPLLIHRLVKTRTLSAGGQPDGDGSNNRHASEYIHAVFLRQYTARSATLIYPEKEN
jgi:hypothetical protein